MKLRTRIYWKATRLWDITHWEWFDKIRDWCFNEELYIDN